MPQPLITIRDAQRTVLEATTRLDPEPVDIEHALDRVLATALTAAGDVPPFACSAMDGYAVIADGQQGRLAIVGESRAGTPSEHTINAGETIRISTGAALPLGATAVVRQEDVSRNGETIELQVSPEPGANVRHPGEDMRAGTPVLAAGTQLEAPHLGAAVAAGAGSVIVTRRPKVSVLCTGDELRAPGEALGPGEIHNSNAPMLAALAIHAGAAAGSPQRLPDDAAATEAGLAAALEAADVLIVTGGVSVGPHDHVRPALSRLGVEQHFWGVSLQPGKPTWFGTHEETLVFGLPGNPVSAAVTFSLFVNPALATMLGTEAPRPPAKQARLSTAVPRNPAREQAIRIRLERTTSEPAATPNGPQGSHILTSLLGADALALIAPGEGDVPVGTLVELAHLAT
ncbi:MAG: molybdopterin molybdotransferase MoeA [Solirubrobacterales bacterium]|nr:molybdopterin molybdotransferase MoeA [Solirubrobacterales bacterium]